MIYGVYIMVDDEKTSYLTNEVDDARISKDIGQSPSPWYLSYYFVDYTSSALGVWLLLFSVKIRLSQFLISVSSSITSPQKKKKKKNT